MRRRSRQALLGQLEPSAQQRGDDPGLERIDIRGRSRYQASAASSARDEVPTSRYRSTPGSRFGSSDSIGVPARARRARPPAVRYGGRCWTFDCAPARASGVMRSLARARRGPRCAGSSSPDSTESTRARDVLLATPGPAPVRGDNGLPHAAATGAAGRTEDGCSSPRARASRAPAQTPDRVRRHATGVRRQSQRLGPIAEALSQTGHERIVRLGIAAVPVARQRGAWKAPVQGIHDLAADAVLHVEYVVQFEIVRLRRRHPLHRRIEQLYRDAPMALDLLHGSLQRITNAKFAGDLRGFDYPRRSSESRTSARPRRLPGY